ncbi:opine metallophore biosynthesis dehydrogenase [Lysinibacillus capsici]
MLSKGIVSSLHIAKVLKVTCPTLDHFVQTYEEKLLQVVALSENQRLSEAFQIKSFSQEIGDDL